MVRFARDRVGPIVRLFFHPTITGLENLPQEGAYLLVSNHNAGLGLAEIFSFAALWAEKFEGERPIAAFAHPLGFKFWPMTAVHDALGSVPSTYEAAYETLEMGVPILVFPGGDHETLRPVWQANRVDFGGRKGFLRIAKKMNCTIVPMAIQGSHYTAPMLMRARFLAWLLVIPRALGQKRWGISLLGLIGLIPIFFLPLDAWIRAVVAMVWLSTPLNLVPWIPWTIRFKIGAPIEPSTLFASDDLDDTLHTVEATIQALLVDDTGGLGAENEA